MPRNENSSHNVHLQKEVNISLLASVNTHGITPGNTIKLGVETQLRGRCQKILGTKL